MYEPIPHVVRLDEQIKELFNFPSPHVYGLIREYCNDLEIAANNSCINEHLDNIRIETEMVFKDSYEHGFSREKVKLNLIGDISAIEDELRYRKINLNQN